MTSKNILSDHWLWLSSRTQASKVQCILRLTGSEDKRDWVADLYVFRNRLWLLLLMNDKVVPASSKVWFICREEFVAKGLNFWWRLVVRKLPKAKGLLYFLLRYYSKFSSSVFPELFSETEWITSLMPGALPALEKNPIVILNVLPITICISTTPHLDSRGLHTIITEQNIFFFPGDFISREYRPRKLLVKSLSLR